MKHKPKASPLVSKAPWYGETKFHLYFEDRRELIFKCDSTNTESTQEEKESTPKRKPRKPYWQP